MEKEDPTIDSVLTRALKLEQIGYAATAEDVREFVSHMRRIASDLEEFHEKMKKIAPLLDAVDTNDDVKIETAVVEWRRKSGRKS